MTARRIAHLDCSSGVSGDKLLGAIVDAGTRLHDADGRPAFGAEDLRELVARFAPEATVRVAAGTSHGLACTRVHLEGPSLPEHRHLGDLQDRVRACGLSEDLTALAMAVLDELAAAEALVHGTTVEEVHFHEVGGLDTVLDVVGAIVGLDALGIDALTVTPVATGSGTIEIAHGVVPVPAPATAQLLLGVPTVTGPSAPGGGPAGELTTPTGAALVRTLATSFGDAPLMTPRAVGYGAGTRDIGTPNVTRLIVGEAADETRIPLTRERIVLLETNLDHLAPEQTSYVLDELIAEGALDAWLTPIVMKKGRAATLLSVLTLSEFGDATAVRIVELTGTLGVRRSEIERDIADREIHEVETPWGVACVKIGGGTVRPEHDDVAHIAREHALPYGFVRDEITRLALEQS